VSFSPESFLFPFAFWKHNIKVYRKLPFASYGCKTLSVTIREEYGLRIFKNRLVRKMHEPKRTEVTGGWRKLPNDSFMVCNWLPSIWVIKCRIRWAGCVACMDDM
jgi:hypothetical protein